MHEIFFSGNFKLRSFINNYDELGVTSLTDFLPIILKYSTNLLYETFRYLHFRTPRKKENARNLLI